MDLTAIITLIVIIVVLSLVFTLLKKLIKWFFIINILVVIVLVIFSYMVYTDAKQFQENFPDAEKLFLLDINNKIVAALSVTTQDEEPVAFSADQLPAYNKELAEDYYRTFTVKLEAFDFIETVEISDDILPASFIYELLESDDAISLYAQKKAEGVPGSSVELIKESIAERIADNTEFKSQLFGTLLGKAMEQKGPQFILEGLKSETISIYPETIIFKIIKKAPSFLTNKLSKVVGTA